MSISLILNYKVSCATLLVYLVEDKVEGSLTINEDGTWEADYTIEDTVECVMLKIPVKLKG